MGYLWAILMGIAEGVTEWLPVSSTGHMLLLDSLFHYPVREAFRSLFLAVVQLGAALAIPFYFGRGMLPFCKDAKGRVTLDRRTFLVWCRVAVACLPGAVVALLWGDAIEARLWRVEVIAAMLMLWGVLFMLASRKNKKSPPTVGEIGDISTSTALFIGLFQVFSIIPGTSRSGATILGAMLLGVSRPAAAAFTFYMALPVMLGWGGVKALTLGVALTGAECALLLAGTLVAFLVSLATVRFLMGFVKRHSLFAFGIYRILLGLAVLWVVK